MVNSTKHLLVIVCIFCSFIVVNAQNGWRKKEMEIKVSVQSKQDAEKLHDLHLIGDVYQSAGYGLMYVIPEELKKIESSGLQYEITKSDLNEFYKDFWLKKETQNRTGATGTMQYHSYNEIIQLMDSLVLAFPDICKKFTYGTSVQNRQLCCLKISDNVNIDENEAEILLDGGIHGDEVGGAENVIRFARQLCSEYNVNSTTTNRINNREIWIYPMINPDGRVNVSRYNGNNVDLNRDFGYMWDGEGNSTSTYSQPETKAIREFIYNNQFVFHLNCHSGSENVFFPWCHRPAHAPDYSNFNTISNLYASSSTYPSLICGQSNADYATTGELDDCSYGVNGTMGLVLEISNNKQPPESQLLTYYNRNVPAMKMLLEYSGYGIEGVVTDSVSGNPVAAVVFSDSFYPMYSDPIIGDYHKFVLPGTHTIKVCANNYKTKIISGITVSNQTSTVVNVKLEPLDGHYIYKIVSAKIPGNNPADEGNTPAVIGAPDNVFYSIGKSGTIIVDMGYPIANIAGNDLRVIEGGSSPEGYTCYAGQNMDGPWKLLGTGTGTTAFDLTSGSLANARFIKIVDDGNGTALANDAGFDLDAIKDLNSSSPLGVPEGISSEDPVLFYPNPFNELINLNYSIRNGATVKLAIYNSLGEEVIAVNEVKTSAGNYSLQFNTSLLSPGIYFCTFETANQTVSFSKRIVKY